MSELAQRLTAELAEHVAAQRHRVAILGLTAEAVTVAAAAREMGGEVSIYDPEFPDGNPPLLSAWEELAPSAPEILVVAEDTAKESLLRAAATALDNVLPLAHVVLGGVAQQTRPDPIFEELERPALVRSYATGHPHTRNHLFDCLRSAAAHQRSGAVVELGAFKGGTSVWLARAVELLRLRECPVIAFDSWDGFPPRRSLLDLYQHERCVFSDLDAVRRHTEPYDIELVAGDIFETAPARLAQEPVLLAFVDTDNYSGTRAALEVILGNLVAGGAIVLDHFFTGAEYAYTVGERMAAVEVLGNSGLLQLHGTGVFVNVA